MSFPVVVLVVSIVSTVGSLWTWVRVKYHLEQCSQLLSESAEIRAIYHDALMYYAGTENGAQALYALEKVAAVAVDGKAGAAK